MIPPSDHGSPIKMAGYLEKRSKMRVVCRWKKLWFVLEGRLLLYYKSQLEYLSLSPCRGTVNLGLAASVSPGKSNEIIVSTRSNTVSLRALNRMDHDVWLQALMDALHLPNGSHAACCTSPVHHFRYSLGGLKEHEILEAREVGRVDTRSSPRVNTRPSAAELIRQEDRLRRIAASDTALSGRCRPDQLRRSVSVEDNRCYTDNIYETVDPRRPEPALSKRVIRSDSDCVMSRQRACPRSLFRSEQVLQGLAEWPEPAGRSTLVEFGSLRPPDRLIRMKFHQNHQGLTRRSKDIKSDTDLAIRRPQRVQSASCSGLANPYFLEMQPRFSQHVQLPSKVTRNSSILKQIAATKNNIPGYPLAKKSSVKTRSLSFLRRIWKKKEPKIEDSVSFNTEENDMQEINHLSSEMGSSSGYSAVELTGADSPKSSLPAAEPPPDYPVSRNQEMEGEVAPSLPPRKGPGAGVRPVSPTHDRPRNNQPLEQPPALPAKKGRKVPRPEVEEWASSSRPEAPPCLEESWAPGLRRLFREDGDNELNDILRQLAGLNTAFNQITSADREDSSDDDPDYDVPRSLLPQLISPPTTSDVIPPTNFFTHFEDSLDVIRDNEGDFSMAPDSLECDPWSLTEPETRWSPPGGARRVLIADQFGLEHPPPVRHYFNLPAGFIQLHT